MVGRSYILFLILISFPVFGLDNVRFATEFTKSSIFSGEQTHCNFVLYTTEEIINIEVAKFPEFRGYWKENLILRQGRINMRFESVAKRPWRKVTIGSYVISPMVGERNPSIEPMKLVIDFNGQQHTIYSTAEPFEVKPLPQMPLEIRPSSFTGAVGNFKLFPSNKGVTFRTGEPTLVRYILQGEGNFQDINSLRLEFPEGAEILSERTFTQGSASYSLKSFDYIVTFKENSDFQLPEISFTYFDPSAREYKSVKAPEMPANRLEPIAEEVLEAQDITLGQLQQSWNTYQPTYQSPKFWLLFLFSVCIFGFLSLSPKWKRLKQHSSKQTPGLDPSALEDAESAYRAGKLERFLYLAASIALKYYQLFVARRSDGGIQRREIQSASHTNEKARIVNRLLDARDEVSYSREKRPKQPEQQLYESFKSLVNK